MSIPQTTLPKYFRWSPSAGAKAYEQSRFIRVGAPQTDKFHLKLRNDPDKAFKTEPGKRFLSSAIKKWNEGGNDIYIPAPNFRITGTAQDVYTALENYKRLNPGTDFNIDTVIRGAITRDNFNTSQHQAYVTEIDRQATFRERSKTSKMDDVPDFWVDLLPLMVKKLTLKNLVSISKDTVSHRGGRKNVGPLISRLKPGKIFKPVKTNSTKQETRPQVITEKTRVTNVVMKDGLPLYMVNVKTADNYGALVKLINQLVVDGSINENTKIAAMDEANSWFSGTTSNNVITPVPFRPAPLIPRSQTPTRQI